MGKNTLATVFLFAQLLHGISAKAQAIASGQPPLPANDDQTLKDLGAIRVDTVNGASKFVQQVIEAPSSVTIITADEIQKYGYRTLADALQSVPGLYVSYDRDYSYLGMRGFNRAGDYNNRILILIDGHRMNDAIYDAAFIGTEFPIDIDLIQRIEVIRGPGSALYGSNAFFGIVNVITKRGSDLKGPEISAAGGSLETYRTRISYGKQFSSGLEGLVSWSGYRSQGYRQLYFPEFDTPATNNGIAQDADADEFTSSFLSASYRGLSIHSAYVWRQKHSPTASFGTVFNDLRNKDIDSRGYLDLEFQHTLRSQWQLDTRAFYDESGYNGTYVYDLRDTTPLITLNHDSSRGQSLGFEVSASRRFREKHRLTIGTEARFNIEQLQQSYYDDPSGFVSYDRRSSTIPGAYALDEFRIQKHFLLSAGVRFDHYYTFGGTTNPRLGLIYFPRQNTAIKLLYGQAFRAPNVYELYYSDGTSVQADPSLQPERIRTTELAFEEYFSNHISIRASAFLNQIRDLITESQDSQNLITYVTRQNVDGKGLEFEFNDKLPGAWDARLSYTASNSKDAQSQQALSNDPRHLAKASLSAPVIHKILFASAEAQYVGRRLSVTGAGVPDDFVTNLSLTAPGLPGNISFSASVYNLFDAIRRPGRTGAHRNCHPSGRPHGHRQAHVSSRIEELETAFRRLMEAQPPRQRFQRAVCALAVVLLTGFLPAGRAQDGPFSEYQVKARYLYNFALFTEWPEQSFHGPNAPFILGIVGRDPFGAALDDLTTSGTLRGRKVIVERLTRDQDLRHCQVLFISRSEKDHLGPIFSKLAGASVLTVSEIEGFSSSGGMIGLVFDDDRIRFEINLDTASDAGLTVSAKLSSLARTVRRGLSIPKTNGSSPASNLAGKTEFP